MRLVLKDIADLFNVSESTVHKWIRDRGLPNRRVRSNLVFNRMEVLEWATETGKRVSPKIAEPLCDPQLRPSLIDALTVGGVHYGIAGGDVRTVVASIVGVLNLPNDTERELLRRVLPARKSLGFVRIGDGFHDSASEKPPRLEHEPKFGFALLSGTAHRMERRGRKTRSYDIYYSYPLYPFACTFPLSTRLRLARCEIAGGD
jgi:excisionase family DNA binding protein